MRIDHEIALTACVLSELEAVCSVRERGTDTLRALQVLAGMVLELSLLADSPEDARKRILVEHPHWSADLPNPLKDEESFRLCAADSLDALGEYGRALSGKIAQEWDLSIEEIFRATVFVLRQSLSLWAEDGHCPKQSFRIFLNCLDRLSIYERAAQDLCDLAIDTGIGQNGWSLSDCLTGLSAMAGRRLALASIPDKNPMYPVGYGENTGNNVTLLVCVVTREAVRHGVPGIKNWRGGIVANDCDVKAPWRLIAELETPCRDFFESVKLDNLHDQAVACAKAAGRMLAVAAGGELPEMEPTVASPLTLSALAGMYDDVLPERSIVS